MEKVKVAQRAERFLTGIAAIVGLWVLLLVPVGVTMAVMGTISGITTNPGIIGTVAAILAIGIAVLGIGGYLWAKETSEPETQVAGMNDTKISPVIGVFRVRARMYKLAAVALFALLTTATIGGFFLISEPSRGRERYHERLPGELEGYAQGLASLETELGGPSVSITPENMELLTAILNRSSYPSWQESIGAVAVWLVLVQATASLFRYMIQISSFYDSRADYLQLGGTMDSAKVLEIIDPGPLNTIGWVREWIRASGPKAPLA
ncbi:MAG: hypothetical protein OXH52_09980 [Gammaproteobacteria bacterium]|nr:hypothetical protein [Gammaproteobacteria bacterium]